MSRATMETKRNYELEWEVSRLLFRPQSAMAYLPSAADGANPKSARPRTAAEIKSRPLGTRQRASTARKERLLKKCIGDPRHQVRERRLTLVDALPGIGEVDGLLKRLNLALSEKDANLKDENEQSKLLQQIEDGISLDQLKEVKLAFQKRGEQGISLSDFKEVFRVVLGIDNVETQIERLFMKIDTSSDGYIDWDEFCSYMQLEYAEKEAVSRRAMQVGFELPPIQSNAIHRDEVCRISSLGDNGILSISQDGTLAFWKNNLTLEKSIKLGNVDDNRAGKNTWITDCVVVPNQNRIFTFTGDRDILVYDSISLELYCRIGGLNSVPLRVSYFADDFKVILLMGDEKGVVSILIMKRLGDTLREWKNNKRESGVPTISILEAAKHPNVWFFKWKAHKDWVTEVTYIKELNAIISSSNHTSSGICISSMPDIGDIYQTSKTSTRQFHEDSFRPSLNYINISKGVKTFAFSSRGNTLVTGGIDRIVRVYNIPSRTFHITKANGFLKGHNNPITYVGIDPKENRLLTTSQDSVIRVWDISEQTCLLTLNPKTHRIRGDFNAIYYSPNLKCITIATDVINMLQMQISSPGRNVNMNGGAISMSHFRPITSACYNHTFCQIVTADDEGVVKVWDLESNRKTFEFSIKISISCLNFDSSHRRLIVGCRDGTTRLYNHNNGGLLKILKPAKLGREVAVVFQIHLGQSDYIISLGWDRRINLFPELDKKHVLEQKALPYWRDDEKYGHKEDIIAASKLHNNSLATASFDGEIIIWNLVSGHASQRLNGQIHNPSDACKTSIQVHLEEHDDPFNIIKKGGPYILDMVSYKKYLIAGHASGKLLFYNLLGAKITLMQGTKVSNSPICALAVTTKDDVNNDGELLWVGNSFGEIIAIDILEYVSNDPKETHPEVHLKWRAHTESITSIALIEQRDIIVSSSLDCTCRVWTYEGQFIGTFGQSLNWDINNDATWSHPYMPDDVLVDPSSIPPVPSEDPLAAIQKQNKAKLETQNEHKLWLDGIRESLRNSDGKRLKIQRYLSTHPKEVAKDPAANAFRALKVHEMFPEPEFQKPKKQNEDDFLLQLAKEIR